MNKKYWFTARKYGMGWRPASWEGWLVTIVYIFTVYYIAIKNTAQLEAGEVKSFFTLVGALTFVFIAIAYRTGESLRWRWGDKEND